MKVARYEQVPAESPEEAQLPSTLKSPSIISSYSTSTIVIVALCATFLTLVLATVAPQSVFSLPMNSIQAVNHVSSHFCKDHLGGVASESKTCSNIGIDILRQGGNAADSVRYTRLRPFPSETDNVIDDCHDALRRSDCRGS